jgi:hypothetical protein
LCLCLHLAPHAHLKFLSKRNVSGGYEVTRGNVAHQLDVIGKSDRQATELATAGCWNEFGIDGVTTLSVEHFAGQRAAEMSRAQDASKIVGAAGGKPKPACGTPRPQALATTAISIADLLPSRNDLNIWEFIPACFASALVKPWKPGQSGNLNGRPAGSRTAFSAGFLKDLAEVWAKHGKQTMVSTAQTNPTVFFATCARLIGPEVKLRIEQSLPGNLAMDEWPACIGTGRPSLGSGRP